MNKRTCLQELLERRENQMSEFRDWYARLRHELNRPREKQQRLQLRGLFVLWFALWIIGTATMNQINPKYIMYIEKDTDDRERAATREMVEEQFEFLVSVNREN